MLSCDTFVLPAEANFFGSNMAAKNSDRPIGEAQALTWTDGVIYSTGAKYLQLCVAGRRDLLRSLFQVILLDIEIDVCLRKWA